MTRVGPVEVQQDHPQLDSALARAHDKTINDTISDNRCASSDNTAARPCVNRPEPASPPLDDGVDAAYLEEELKEKYRVEFLRTPRNERTLFKNARYLGETRVVNGKFGYAYRTHLWLVEYVSIGSIDFDTPLPGIMQITTKRWRSADLPDPRSAFQGLSSVTANKHAQIVQIESCLGARQ